MDRDPIGEAKGAFGERRSGEDDDGQSQADDGEKARADGETFCLERRILLAERRLQDEPSGSIGAARLSTDAFVFLVIAKHDPGLSSLAGA
jgi:hypothetical protein